MHFLPCQLSRLLQGTYPGLLCNSYPLFPGEQSGRKIGTKMETVPASLLTIAGFDPSSGAGMTADLKVFAAFGAYGLACPTAWTVQSTVGVQRVSAADPAFVRETLDCLSSDITIAGVKIGMLTDAAILAAVITWLHSFLQQFPTAPVVLDPVLRSSSGHSLLSEDAVPLLRHELLPLVSVVTPNLAEAELLSSIPIDSRASAEAAGAAIRALMCRAGAVVVTGGHLPGADVPEGNAPDDLILLPNEPPRWISGEWIETSSTHGTGCAFSSALLALLVQGASLPEAVRGAKRYIEGALRAAYPVGKGRGPMHHLYKFRV
jgi:hydroxymethylpyrimidine/phosphomethylpyrimidine kinase